MENGTILTVDPDEVMLQCLELTLNSQGYTVETARSLAVALDLLRTKPFHCIVADATFCQDDGSSLLDHVSDTQPSTPVIVVAEQASITDAVQFVKMGAANYLPKDQVHSRVAAAVEEVASSETASTVVPVEEDMESPQELREFIGNHHVIRGVLRTIVSAAQSSATILIEGESGTGKTFLAKLIHRLSPRRHGPFVEVSCGGLPESLLNSELFGYERGSFTSSVRTTIGKFEHANGGTIFLDGITNAPASLQMKLLRVVDDHVLERVGGVETIEVDVRIITASNQPLLEEVEQDRFRRDLYHRLRVITVALPPLRERITDVPALAGHFLQELAEKHQKDTRRLSPDAMQAMVHYQWPGNVRELKNAIEHAVIMCPGEEVEEHHLPAFVAGPQDDNPNGVWGHRTLKRAVEELERKHLLRALETTNGNKQQAAELLRICRATLYNKLAKYNLPGELT